ncbi:MAG: hypothetical protein HRU13_06200 [Phycisphaerales bacterium]|nr:hypothetical protein [Phycisphaerales bacterium]
MVATLALLAILTVAYVSIGGGDRRAAQATTFGAEVDRQAEHVADYLVGIVGDDAVSVYFQGFDANGDPVFMTEAVDVPRTDPNRTYDGLSAFPTTTPEVQSSYFGLAFNPTGSLPPLRPDEDDATDLARDILSGLRPFGPSDPFLAASEPTFIREAGGSFSSGPAYEDRVDWAKISNISPNGLYVNLFQIRGNFDASPGLEEGEMNDPIAMILLERGGSPTTDLVYGGIADPGIPAHFDSQQIELFRPVGSGGFDPDESNNFLYHFADADGDGFFDSRWQELVDITAESGPRSVVTQEGQLRWFVAARIVDLSGRVNVNTARALQQFDLPPGLSDYIGRPDNGNRFGSSPAETSLLRLLTMEPQWAMHRELYGAIPSPPLGAQDYSDYDSYPDDGLPVGESGYDALRLVASGQVPPPGDLSGFPDLLLALQTAGDRREEFESQRFSGPLARASSGSGVTRQFGFGLEDLRDLLAYEGLNDPSSLSSLERAVGGRYGVEETFSPLRENRTLQWERAAPQSPTDLGPLALRHLSARKNLTTLSGGILRTPTKVDFGGPAPTGLDMYRFLAQPLENAVADDPFDADASIVQDGYQLLSQAAPEPLPIGSGTTQQQEDDSRRLRDAHALFRTYARALMPAADEPDAWNVPNWESTFYGWQPAGSPALPFDRLFALRSAAHLTANMIDAYDGDDIPSAFTVLVAGDRAPEVSAEPDVFPWWNELAGLSTGTGLANASGRLDLGEARLPDFGDVGGTAIAMNVYGLEAHPFITQVSLYNVFTDSTAGADESPPPDPDPGTPGLGTGVDPNPITIDFATNSGNVDFVGQVFAVQLSNPYPSLIEVREGQYFVRFGNLGGFDGAPSLDGLAIPAGTEIPGRSTITLYALTADFAQRADDATPGFAEIGSTPEAVESVIEDWIATQFEVATRDPSGSLSTSAVQPVSFGPIPGAIDDILASTPGDVDFNRSVTLWTRLNRANGGSSEVVDVMLDRMFDPGDPGDPPTLDRRPPANEIEIGVTAAGPDDGSVAAALDNTGFSIVTWGTFARPNTVAQAPLGALPAYVLEAPFADPLGSLNRADDDRTNLDSGFGLDRGQFLGGGKLEFAEEFLVSVFDRTGVPTRGTTGVRAQYQTDIGLPAVDTQHSLREPIDGPDHLADIEFADLYVNPFRNDNQGRLTSNDEVLRPGDFLGVPAVGPVQMPIYFDDESGSPPVIDPEELSWLTTGELLTLALGYRNAPELSTLDSFPSLPVDTAALLDRGHLRVSRNDPTSAPLFAPFVDVDGDDMFDSTQDERRGLGVPHAMALLSSVTTKGVPVDELTPISGLVNINTATEPVMTVLPGLTPTTDSDTIDPDAAWMSNGPTDYHDHRADVGAGVRSYRDKSEARPRSPVPEFAAVPFFDSTTAWGDMDPRDTTGRFEATTLDAIREHPGVLSTGELLAVTDPSVGLVGGVAQPVLMSRLAVDATSLDVDGVDPTRYLQGSGSVSEVPGSGSPTFNYDGVADDYDEQFALYNGVANSVTTRSDVYAIWFVLHGYARDDVEGLRPQDPMTPSVARRYLIVVDRSNVRRAGDRARVLLFDEVPL